MIFVCCLTLIVKFDFSVPISPLNYNNFSYSFPFYLDYADPKYINSENEILIDMYNNLTNFLYEFSTFNLIFMPNSSALRLTDRLINFHSFVYFDLKNNTEYSL